MVECVLSIGRLQNERETGAGCRHSTMRSAFPSRPIPIRRGGRVGGVARVLPVVVVDRVVDRSLRFLYFVLAAAAYRIILPRQTTTRGTLVPVSAALRVCCGLRYLLLGLEVGWPSPCCLTVWGTRLV